MRLTFAVSAVLTAALLQPPLAGQLTQSDKYKLAPLLATARLWNMIRYLHPRLAGDSTPWDDALIAALPNIENSHSDEELAVALDNMLATLRDPCTRIAYGMPGKSVSVESFDATMVIHAGNGDLSGSLGAGLMLKMGIPQTSNLVWDIRGARLPFQLSSRPDISLLTTNGMGYAYREHSGYAPPDGIGQRSYFSSLQMVDAQPGVARQPNTRAQIYLVDKNSAIPVQAIVDQIQGRSAILSEDSPAPLQAGFTELVKVLGKVVAEVRVADLRYPDGTTEFAPTRVMLNHGAEAVKAAVNAVSGGWAIPGDRPKYQPGPAGFRDAPYAADPYPSREKRILAAFRIWGVLHYFDPYVSTIDDQWDNTLLELLPKFAEAKDAREFHLAVAQFAARSGDPNCSPRSPQLLELFGLATPPFEVRIIENRPVVTRRLAASSAKTDGLKSGDVILKIDGEPVQTRIDLLSSHASGPSRDALDAKVGRFLLTANSTRTIKLTVQGQDGSPREVAVAVDTANQNALPAPRSGDAVRLINERIGYADLERLDAGAVDSMFDKLSPASAIIFDFRGLPKNDALVIAARLADRNQPLVAELFRNIVGRSETDSHISFLQSQIRVPRSTKPRYQGKTVALIDDLSSTLTGESAMCLKAANKTTLIGSPVLPLFFSRATSFDVPGGIRMYFSGEIPRWPSGGLLYPDGIKPDVEVRPTIAGIRAGKDEVLDAAVAYLLKQ